MVTDCRAQVDERLGDPTKRKFYFESCSGAVVQDVIDDQIPALGFGQQVILLSAGGNDAELLNILNQCVLQWLAFSDAQWFIGKIASWKGDKWANAWDWNKYSRGCEGQLKVSENIIRRDEFGNRLDTMIEAAKRKLSPDGMIYHTGYAKFFGTDYDTACNKVSWTVWIFVRFGLGCAAMLRLTIQRRKPTADCKMSSL
ncbi:hypothetical protein NW754_005781 [Fusarium falciforme]|nr:hypothetical protein NW754_005781 [Fusarium falciforme]